MQTALEAHAVTIPIFIDGQDGTTGLQLRERLQNRPDLALLEIDPARRKDPEAKRALLREAQVVVLCLPDAAARETAALVEGRTRILDASTAHRVSDGWTYGLPELAPDQRARIATAARVANPGCYPTGFLLIARPLRDANILPADYPLTVHAQSGYSGGGRKLIEAFAAHPRCGASPDWTVRPYGLSLAHKHVPEMQRYAELSAPPLFCPQAGDYYQGMLVHVPLHVRALRERVTPAQVHALLAERYAAEPFIEVMPLYGLASLDNGCLDATALNGTNKLQLFVFGHAEQILVTARLDNLGKGAAGAAVQNLNLMLGCDERLGLDPSATAPAAPAAK